MNRYPILDFFNTDHLPDNLREVARPFAELAWQVAQRSPKGDAETEAALRKLLEAKGCAVRAAL